ncbi:MAG: helix-turn-helix domain-containing protein [Chloroflexota bacterium]
MSEEPLYLTVAEFAELYRLPRSSVYEAIATERLAHQRVGKAIRIHRDAAFVPARPAMTRRRRRSRGLVIVRTNRPQRKVGGSR